MTVSLDNKVVIVSGGTKGVGKAVVLQAARQGAKVVFGGRDRKAAAENINTIEEFGGQGLFVEIDLRKTQDCRRLFDRAIDAFDRVDGFFNYAGITTPASLLDCDDENFDSIFDVNVRAALFCCQHAVRHMKKSGGGSIILVGSPHAWSGERDRVAYACSKGALLTLTRHISEHYARFGVRANCITMGWTATEGEIALRQRQGMTEDKLREWASSTLPSGRMTEVDDFVPGIIYLLSDDSRMVSGSNLRITGGWYL